MTEVTGACHHVVGHQCQSAERAFVLTPTTEPSTVHRLNSGRKRPPWSGRTTAVFLRRRTSTSPLSTKSDPFVYPGKPQPHQQHREQRWTSADASIGPGEITWWTINASLPTMEARARTTERSTATPNPTVDKWRPTRFGPTTAVVRPWLTSTLPWWMKCHLHPIHAGEPHAHQQHRTPLFMPTINGAGDVVSIKGPEHLFLPSGVSFRIQTAHDFPVHQPNCGAPLPDMNMVQQQRRFSLKTTWRN